MSFSNEHRLFAYPGNYPKLNSHIFPKSVRTVQLDEKCAESYLSLYCFGDDSLLFSTDDIISTFKTSSLPNNCLTSR